MEYRELNLSRLDEVIPMFIETFNEEPWNDKWTEEITKKRLTQMLNCEGAYGLVAYLNNEVVGMILGNHEYYYTGMQFVIKEFCVNNKLKGKGIGTKLLNEFEEKLKSKGIKEIVLTTLRNEKTEGYYKNRGYGEIQESVIMQKKL